MNYQLLELHLSQLNKVWEKSKYNKYSDNKKELYHYNLGLLIEQICLEDFNKLNQTQLLERKKILDFIFKSLEFLDKSTFNQIPFEIIHCLKVALKQWLKPGDDYIIVTSLVNGVIDFSFDPILVIYNDYYRIIKKIYGITFISRLVQINLPVYLSRDYLANVVLYHELGHFVDLRFQISESLYNKILNDYYNLNLLTPSQEKDLLEYFPYLSDPIYKDAFKKGIDIYIVKSHIAEYFCDLFASQYIENCSGYYLNYLTESQTSYSSSHPSTINRIKLVNLFLSSNTSNYILENIREAAFMITNNNLQIRYKKYKNDADFISLIPVNISNEDELHFLFINAWKIWLDDWGKIITKNKFAYPLSQRRVYDFLNNLIEKSIGNYIVISDWNNSLKNVSGKK